MFKDGDKIKVIKSIAYYHADGGITELKGLDGTVVRPFGINHSTPKFIVRLLVEYKNAVESKDMVFDQDWLELLADAKTGCTCEITALMAVGCKCGQIQRERG